MDRHSVYERTIWRAREVSKLRQLLQLLVQMSDCCSASSSSNRGNGSSSASSSSGGQGTGRPAPRSATVPPGGVVVHADLKPS
jgi:hypothetical protein